MRRVHAVALLLFGVTILGWGQSPGSKGYHEYRYRLVKVFEEGSGPQALSYATKSGAAQNVFGPTGLRYLARGQWQILDRGNARLVWMDETFTATRTQDSGLEGFSYLSPSGDFALRFFYGGEEIGLTIVAEDSSGNQIFVISDERQQVRQIFAVMNENAIFVQNDKQEWSSLPFSKDRLTSESNQKLWNPQQTLAELKPGGEWSKRGFFVNASGNLLYKGLVLGNRYDVFLSVYEGLRDFYPKTIQSDLYPAERYLDSSRFTLFYRGVDSNKNSYWAMGANEAMVFDTSGSLIEKFAALGYEATKALVLHPSGTMYQYGTYAKIFAVDNVWDAKAKALWQQGTDPPVPPADVSLGTFQIPVGLWWQGTLTDSGVRMRLKPTLQGKILSALNAGTPVTILEATAEAMKIESMEAPWYLVRTWEGLQGWVYGGFVRVRR